MARKTTEQKSILPSAEATGKGNVRHRTTRTKSVKTIRSESDAAGPDASAADLAAVEPHSPSERIEVSPQAAAAPVSAYDPANAREEIALIAYHYWEARGRQGGSAEEDWLRAEEEYRRRVASR